ncbi:MAG: hypothetical protein IPG04_24775 [Polyangiaceae bacterium]|nr:hypothetical protein [Polyangiaceae bacterium]
MTHALATPWCYPHDPDLAALAKRRGLEPPAAPLAGATAFVTVTEGGVRTSLYVLAPRDPHQGSLPTPFGEEARRAVEVAHELVARDLDALSRAARRSGAHLQATLIARSGAGVDQLIEGPSMGLSVALATASLLLERPLPPTLIASAEVTGAGQVRGVGGLGDKLALLANSALGVTTVIVAADQVEPRRERLGFPVPTAAHPSGARRATSAGPGARLLNGAIRPGGLCRDPSHARAAQRLFDLVLSGAPAGWADLRLVTPVARAVAEALAGTWAMCRAPARHPSRSSSWRPCGAVTAESPPPYPCQRAMTSRASRGRVAFGSWPTRSSPPQTRTTPSPGTTWAGRSITSRRRTTRRRATGSSLARSGARLPPSSPTPRRPRTSIRPSKGGARSRPPSPSASPYVRGCGSLPSPRMTPPSWPSAPTSHRWCSTLATHLVSKAYVRLALARAWLLTARPESALAELDEGRLEWRRAPRQLWNVRARMSALALDALGEHGQARSIVGELTREGTDGRAAEQALLARLAIERGPGADDALRELTEHPRLGVEIRRIARRGPGGGRHPTEVLRHFRY